MRKLLPAITVASCALGVGLAAGSLAIANYAPDPAETGYGENEHIFEAADLPMPVMGDELFFAQNNGSVCMDRDAVVSILLADQAAFGGQTVEVISGRDQAFANTWRDQTGMARVAVSGVVGHMFRDGNHGEWTVDVVEFDTDGCAMSRTLVPATAWADLIESSA